jgi:hypothetical protein
MAEMARRRAEEAPPPTNDIKPQPGQQTMFASTSADIAIYGGAAGGGKTFGLQFEVLRHIAKVRGFEAALFRRTTPQITNPGALWDTCFQLYPDTGAVPYVGSHEFRWPEGGKLKLAHLVAEATVHDWQGSHAPNCSPRWRRVAPTRKSRFTGQKTSSCTLPSATATLSLRPDQRCTRA